MSEKSWYKTQFGPFVNPLPGVLPKRVEKSFKFIWKDRTVEVHKGFSAVDALEKAGYGEGAIKDADLWYEIPVGIDHKTISPEEISYVLMVKDTEKSEWRFLKNAGTAKGKEGREILESYGKGCVKRDGYFAAQVIDLSTDRAVSLVY